MFDDVIPNFSKWHGDPYFIKIYTFASGPIEIQKLFLSASIQGDVSYWITSGFDAHHSYKYDTNKYRCVIASLSERDPINLFYLTDSPKKAQAAKCSGMTVFIVLRPGNRKYKQEKLKEFNTINSFDDFIFTEFAQCC